MSHAGGADQPPDLTEAVLGFRVWQLGVKGTLGAMAAGSIWSPGVNHAVCCPSSKPEARPKHRSPHPGCVCGFNAFAALDRETHPHAGTVVGAIAAWGEIDVYEAGFRAEYAQVVALALPPQDRRPRTMERERLDRAAARYSVALVPYERLEMEGLRFASSISPTLLPSAKARRGPSPSRPAAVAHRTGPMPGRTSAPSRTPQIATWDDARGHAIWVRRHVAVRCRKDATDLGPAPGATALLGPDPLVRTLPVGARVEAGAVVASLDTAYPGRRIHLLSPIAGMVRALNGGFAAELLAGDRGVSTAPWLVTLSPDAAAPLDDAPLLWDRPGVELYRQGVSRQSDAAVFAELGPPPGCDDPRLDPLDRPRGLQTQRISLARHQRERTSLSPEKGRRAAIMVEHLRPLLHAVGGAGNDDLQLA